MLFDARIRVDYEVYRVDVDEYIANVSGNGVILFSNEFDNYNSAEEWASTIANILKGHVHA